MLENGRNGDYRRRTAGLAQAVRVLASSRPYRGDREAPGRRLHRAVRAHTVGTKWCCAPALAGARARLNWSTSGDRTADQIDGPRHIALIQDPPDFGSRAARIALDAVLGRPELKLPGAHHGRIDGHHL